MFRFLVVALFVLGLSKPSFSDTFEQTFNCIVKKVHLSAMMDGKSFYLQGFGDDVDPKIESVIKVTFTGRSITDDFPPFLTVIADDENLEGRFVFSGVPHRRRDILKENFPGEIMFQDMISVLKTDIIDLHYQSKNLTLKEYQTNRWEGFLTEIVYSKNPYIYFFHLSCTTTGTNYQKYLNHLIDNDY